jgi:hypothetical protein
MKKEKYEENTILGELVEWLKGNAGSVYASLNEGCKNIPSSWPDALKNFYSFHDGQSADAPFLSPLAGNWLTVKDALMARQEWLKLSEQSDSPDWYLDEYVPIFAYLEQMEEATVVNIKTGEIGTVDYETQEFELTFNNVDEFFANLLSTLKTDGYPLDDFPKYRIKNDDDYRKEALDLEERYRLITSNPTTDELFDWAKSIFRREGDAQFREPNLYMMHLAKKYFDQIPKTTLTNKQAREVAFFNARFQQLIPN